MSIEAAVHDLIYDTLALMRTTDYPRKWKHATHQKQPNGGHVGSFSTEPEFIFFFGSMFQTSKPAFNFLRALNSDKSYQSAFKSLTDQQQQKFWMQPVNLGGFLVNCHLAQHTRLFPNKKLVEEIAANFAYCLKNAVFGVRHVRPIEGFSCNIGEIDLGDGLKIRRYTHNQMLKIFPVKWTGTFVPTTTWPHAIEFAAEYPLSNPPDNFNDKHTFMMRAIHALRLLKPGKVAAPDSKSIPLKPGFIGGYGGKSSSHYRQPIYSSGFHLLPSEIPRLRQLYDALAGQVPKATRIAADRISTSIERRSSEDEFIDHIIALEALFNDTNTATGSITYKIALRAAMMMHDDLHSRQKAFKHIKTALGLRGKVVHGSDTIASMKPAEKEAAEWLSTFARKAVGDILINYPTYNERTADEHILGLSTR